MGQHSDARLYLFLRAVLKIIEGDPHLSVEELAVIRASLKHRNELGRFEGDGVLNLQKLKHHYLWTLNFDPDDIKKLVLSLGRESTTNG